MARSPFPYVLGYGCVTAAGQGASALFNGLIEGVDHSQVADTGGWPKVPLQTARVCLAPGDRSGESGERMARELETAYQEAVSHLEPDRERLLGLGLGVIFASTKGQVEDLVWHPTALGLQADTLAPVLTRFLARTGLKPRRMLAISNACSSVHAALMHAAFWLSRGVVRDVLVLAADHVGPFVVNGFSSLKSLAPERSTPFAAGRQGIQLGEAATALLLSSEPSGKDDLRLTGVDLLTEGHALTRSSDGGETLRRVCETVMRDEARPQIILAHGTGTEANDAMEDRVYRSLLFHAPITCTKWSVGHTLGASGAVDLIAAAEMLRHETVFGIGNTEQIDPAFQAKYVRRGESHRLGGLRRVLVNSVGFGGMHASAMLVRP